MALPAKLPSKVVVDDWMAPNSIVWPDSLPLMLLSGPPSTLIVPAMVSPCWVNTTVKVPDVEGYFLLA